MPFGLTAVREQVVGRQGLALAVGAGGGFLTVVLAAKSSPLVAAAIMAGMAVAGAMFLNPWFGFLLTVLAVPLERIGRFTNDSNMYTFSLMRVLGLITLTGLLARWLIAKRKFAMPAPVRLYVAYIVLALVSLSYTSDWFSGVRQTLVILGNLLFFFLVVNAVSTRREAYTAIYAWLLSTCCIGIFTIYQWHNPAAVVAENRFLVTGERSTEQRFSTVLEDYAEHEALGYVRRAMGPTSSPAVYGINVILALPFYAWLFRKTQNRWVRTAALLGGAVACYNVLLTNTRAAVITFAVCILLSLFTGLVRARLPALLAAAFLSAGVTPFIPNALYDRVFALSNYTAGKSATLRVRLIYWRAAIDIFSDHPLLGIGVGNQSELPKRIREIPMPPNSSVHNEYLESLLETGIVGYPLVIALVVSLYRRCRSAERAFAGWGDTPTQLLLISARIALLCVLFYAVQCDVLHFPLKGWWLTMGLVVVLSEIARNAVQQPPESLVHGAAA